MGLDFFTKDVLVHLHQHLDLLELAVRNATLLKNLHGNVVQLRVHLCLRLVFRDVVFLTLVDAAYLVKNTH